MVKGKLYWPKDPNAPLTLLKKLPRPDQDAIYAYVQEHTLKETRAFVEQKTGIVCKWDQQVADFRRWHWRRALREESEELSAEAAKVLVRAGNSSAIRRDYSNRMLVHAEATGSTQLATEIIRMQIADETLKLRERTEERHFALREQELALQRQRFEWSAAEAALKCLDDLRAISTDGGLTSDQRIEAARKKLFGIVSE